MKYRILSVLAVVAIMSSPAIADEALAKSKNCLACHAMDKKLVGPSFKEISTKYEGRKDGIDFLVTKVKKGGQGTWGPIPMPANAQVTDEEARLLVKWILSPK